MFAVSEIAPGGAQNGQSQSQQQVIASVIALQRVIASRSGAESGGAAGQGFANQQEKAARLTLRASPLAVAERAPEMAPEAGAPAKDASDPSASARSIIEAQEASQMDSEIVAAFQARHGLTDLLSVIRDPDDKMLPTAPPKS